MVSITQLKSGHTYNVFPDSSTLQGSIRSFDKVTLARFKQRVNRICKKFAGAHYCKAQVNLIDYDPAVVNHKDQTELVIHLAKKFIGEYNYSSAELPIMASEDFSYFLEEIPASFFLVGSMKIDK